MKISDTTKRFNKVFLAERKGTALANRQVSTSGNRDCNSQRINLLLKGNELLIFVHQLKQKFESEEGNVSRFNKKKVRQKIPWKLIATVFFLVNLADANVFNDSNNPF